MVLAEKFGSDPNLPTLKEDAALIKIENMEETKYFIGLRKYMCNKSQLYDQGGLY